MIFVDTNVFMYTVGRPHPLQESSRDFFDGAIRSGDELCTSAEVLQELAYAYLSAGRGELFDMAIGVLTDARVLVWPLEQEDVMLARELHKRFPNLASRDLCHLASCIRRRASAMMTFDRELAAAFNDWPDTSREPSV